MPDARAGRKHRGSTAGADALGSVGSHVGRFGAMGHVGQTARRRLWSAWVALGRPSRLDAPSLRVGRGRRAPGEPPQAPGGLNGAAHAPDGRPTPPLINFGGGRSAPNYQAPGGLNGAARAPDGRPTPP